MFLNAKPVAFGNFLKLSIVVEVSGAAGIFDSIFSCKAMAHLMQKCGAGFFYWPAKGGAADVDFVPPFITRLPNLIASEMPISAHGLF